MADLNSLLIVYSVRSTPKSAVGSLQYLCRRYVWHAPLGIMSFVHLVLFARDGGRPVAWLPVREEEDFQTQLVTRVFGSARDWMNLASETGTSRNRWLTRAQQRGFQSRLFSLEIGRCRHDVCLQNGSTIRLQLDFHEKAVWNTWTVVGDMKSPRLVSTHVSCSLGTIMLTVCHNAFPRL